MEDSKILDLYKKGFSINYIVNEIYREEKIRNCFCYYNTEGKKVLVLPDNMTKEKIRNKVYNTLYNFILKK